MEKLQIDYSFKGNGILFVLSPIELENFKRNFPEAQPAISVFVQYDIKSDFRNYHAQLESYIFPVLVGLPKREDLKKIKHIDFIFTRTQTVTYTIDNYEQKVQPVRG